MIDYYVLMNQIGFGVNYNTFLRDKGLQSLSEEIYNRNDTDIDRILDALDTAEQIKYESDKEQFGMIEKWQSPSSTYKRMAGDCEDSSLFLTVLLRGMGYNACSTYGLYKPTNILHVWTTLDYNGGRYVLDPVMKHRTEKIVPIDRAIKDYGYKPYWDIYPYHNVFYTIFGRIPFPRLRRYGIVFSKTSF